MVQIDLFGAKSPESSRLRKRKYALVRRFGIPENVIGGCLSKTHRRCGKPNCHCAEGRGHPRWSVTFSNQGERRVERVPDEWVEQLEQTVVQTQEYLQAIKEVMAINIELLSQARNQKRAGNVRRSKNVRHTQ